MVKQGFDKVKEMKTVVKVLLVLIVIVVGIVGRELWQKRGEKPVGIERQASVSESAQGVVSEYPDFEKELFDQARVEGKIIVLYFFANWCPICREQEPINKLVFTEFSEKIVALRVHILDNQTTEETEALASEYGVSYQHTYVVLNSEGKVVYKYTGPLSEEALRQVLLEQI